MESKQQKIKEQQQALNALIGAVNLAQSKGCYTLQESSVLQKAIETFMPPQKHQLQPIKEDEERKE